MSYFLPKLTFETGYFPFSKSCMDLKHQNLSRHVYEISWDVTISDCHLLFFFREYMLWLWYNKNFNCFEKEKRHLLCEVNCLYLFDRYLLGLCYKLKMAVEVWMWVRMWLDFMIFQTCFVLSVAHHLSFCDTATRGLYCEWIFIWLVHWGLCSWIISLSWNVSCCPRQCLSTNEC